ncbi:MAG: hypothetical protein ABIO94_10770 [Opitutaceae bacterium]
MASSAFKLTLLGLVLIPVTAGIVVLRKDSDRLRQRLAEQRRQDENSARLQEENQQAQKLVAQLQASAADGVRLVQADILRAREEIAALENNARLIHAQKLAQSTAVAEALASNRDPEKGPMPLEYFQNVGQQTPTAAFQTLVWAALKGEDAVLTGVVGLSPEARVKAGALLARMPELDRGQWTPEKLGTLFVSEMLNEIPALQIVAETRENGGRKATLTVHLPSVSKLKEATIQIPLERDTSGWKVIVSERNFERVVRKIQGSENLPESK